MSINRVCTLLFKELRQSYKNFVFLIVIVMPVLLSLLITLIFGQMFAGIPNLGILGSDTSRTAGLIGKNMNVHRYVNQGRMLE